MNIDTYRIDLHHHIIPPEYLKELITAGITESLGRPFPEWSVEKSLSVMDANMIQAAITSISSPGVFFGDPKFAERLARVSNTIVVRGYLAFFYRTQRWYRVK